MNSISGIFLNMAHLTFCSFPIFNLISHNQMIKQTTKNKNYDAPTTEGHLFRTDPDQEHRNYKPAGL